MERKTNSHEYEYEELRRHTPSLRYDGTLPFDKWQTTARAKLTELLGLPLESCEPDTLLEYHRELDDCIEYRMTIQTEPGYYVPCHLLVPKNVPLPAPLTICLSGHGGGMHIALGRAKTPEDEEMLREWSHRAMGPRSIREGRCALIVEARSFGESSVKGYGTSCTETAKLALLMGRTLLGERVWDVMRILDVIAADFAFSVDMSSIVVTGNSGGGTAAFYLGCLDERITACAPSCSVCSYEKSIAAMPHCLCNHIPSVRKYFEMGDLAGLIAPRMLVIAAGIADEIFPIGGTRESFELVKAMYAAASSPNSCALVIGDGGHLNYADLIWAKLSELM